MARGDQLYTYWLATAPVLATPTELATLGPEEEWVVLGVAQGNRAIEYRFSMSFLIFWTDPFGNFGQFGAMSTWALLPNVHIGKYFATHVVVPPNATIFAIVQDAVFEPELSLYGYKLLYKDFPPT